jgi:hypothetical protein
MNLKLPEIDEADYEPMRQLTLRLAETVHTFRQERDRGIPTAPAGQPSHTVEYVPVTPAAFRRYAQQKSIRLPATMEDLQRFASDCEELENA